MITVQDHRRPESRAKHEIYNAFGFATATGEVWVATANMIGRKSIGETLQGFDLAY